MRALQRRQPASLRFGLIVVHAAILALDGGDHRQHQRRTEAPRQPGEDSGAQTGAIAISAFPDLGELLTPERSVLFLDRGEAIIDLAHLRRIFALGKRAIERGAVELPLQIAAVTFGFLLVGHGIDPSTLPDYHQREKETRA